MYPLYYRRWWLAGALALLLLAITASLLPAWRLSLAAGSDKLGHALMYGTLSLWFFGVFRPRYWWPLAMALVGLGATLEFLQGQVPGRRPEVWDLFANLAGVAVGILVAWLGLGGWCQRVESWLPGQTQSG